MKIYSIKVRFQNSSKEYYYKSFEELKVGDFVLTQTKYSVAIAKVTEIDCKETQGKKFVLFKIPNADLVRVLQGMIKEYDQERFLGDYEGVPGPND